MTREPTQHHVRQPGAAVIDRRGIVQWTFNVPPARKLFGKWLGARQPEHEREAIQAAIERVSATMNSETHRLEGDDDAFFRNCELVFAPLGPDWLTVTWRLLPAELSKRERELLSLTCEGITTCAMAHRMLVGRGTIANWRRRITDKTGIVGNVPLSMWAITRGLWHPADSFDEPSTTAEANGGAA